jgi:phenylacetate-CoA ligase
MEEEAGQMRPSAETAFLEVVEQEDDGVGELVVTTLTNEYMPLIRYRTGDLVAPRAAGDGLLYETHGRVGDAFLGPRGQRITTRQVDECFEAVSGVAHYQLHQQAAGDWLLRFVPDPSPPSPAALDELRRRLIDTLEITGTLAFEETPMMLAENSGKFRLGYPQRPLAQPSQMEPG